jgi:lipid-A-disaccharide synthase
MTRPLIYLIAGEPSGDLLGARLMEGLKHKLNDQVDFIGIGGPQMQKQGLNSLFDMSDLSIMGLAEIIPHIPKLLKRIKQTVNHIKDRKPDCLITIDAPGFNFRVTKQLNGKGIPLIHYVAPTVWAWKPKRAKKIAAFLDHLMVLLPFEPPYFEKEGLKTTFVGHSVIESGIDKHSGHDFRERHGIPQDVPLLCVLPGSRRSETDQMLPIYQNALKNLKKKHPNLRLVLPTVSTVSAYVKEQTANWGLPILVVEGNDEKFGAFNAANAAIAASGTVSLELGLARVPTVITYRLKPLTYKIAKKLIKVKYVSIINLLLDKRVMPELLQNDCTAENIATEVDRLLSQKDQLLEYQSDLNSALDQLGLNGPEKPSLRAAQCVIDIISKGKSHV